MKKLRHNLAMVLIIALFAAYCGGRTDNANNAESGITGSGETATPPVVNSITPANNATGANRDVAIQVTFSVVVNTASVTMTSNTTCTGSIQVSTTSNFAAGTCIPMNQNVTQSGTQITVRAAGLLTATTNYYVLITTAVAGSTGLTMTTQYNSEFQTGTSITPLTNEFGTDCTAGADTLAQAETGMTSTEANLGTARTISGLVVTGIDRFSSFYLQKGNDAIYVDVSTSGTACGGSGCAGNKASHYGLQVGDEICMTITRGQSNFSVPTVRDFSAIKKSGVSSVTAYNVNVSGLPAAADISRSVTITGFISQKGTVGSNTDHYLTFNNTQIVIRDSSSTKFTNYNVGDYVTLNSVVGWFSGSPQIAIDSGVGSVSSAGTAPTYSVTGTVTGWTAGENFTITLNGANATVISANGAFSFTGSPTITGQYTVAVSVNPATYQCSITNATGYGLANITNVSIACNPPPIYSFTSLASGDALSSVSMTFRCTPTAGDGNALLANTPAGSYTGATTIASPSFGVLGMGATGISFSNTGSANAICNGGAGTGFISALDIPVNTTGKSGITLQFRAGQFLNQTRDWALRLQYSIDGTTFTDFDSTGNRDFDSSKAGSAVYTDAVGMFTFGPYLLPAGANNNPNLVIRWRYYQTASTGGSVTRMVMDDILVTDGGTTDSTAPTNGTLSLTGTGTDAALTWTAGSDNANAAANLVYRVYRHTSSFTAPGTGTLVYASLPGQMAYTDTGLTPGTSYFYRLIAVDSQGNISSQSNETNYTPADTTPPANPASVTFTGGNASVTIGWNNPADSDFAGVKIVRADATATAPADCSSGTEVCVGTACNANVTASATGLSYVNTGLSNGTQYAYRICSRDAVPNTSAGVTGTATPTNAFNVNSAASTGNTTATVTFSAAPVTSEAQTSGNYKIVAGAGVCGTTFAEGDGALIAVSNASLSGSVVTLTTAAQTASTSYKVCVFNVTRSGDAAALTTNNANFTGSGSVVTLFTFTDAGTLNGLTPKCVVSSTTNNTTLTNATNGTWDAAFLAAGSTSLGFGNQAANGLSVLATGTTGTIGAANCSAGTGSFSMGVMDKAIDATGRTNLTVSWTGRTITASGGCPTTPRTFAIRLQYSSDGGANFSDATGPSEYVANCTGGHSQAFTNVALPGSADGNANVIVRWRYYAVDTAGSGSRPKLAIDEITVSGN